ncbi:hypothetical protein Cni_G16438 [Canna indica]|uniref:Uncharacterized protein n=1 Tax=Canna indica TaxID=4628 RepID=A0AAQ3KL00_9LILI|nr:hypothetical protein Cni_G16438 [Canna indica]
MTSSVARMTNADDWRDPGRLVAVFGATHGHTSFAPASLKKVLVRQKKRGDGNSSSPAPAVSSSTTSGKSFVNEEDGGDSPATSRHRQSQFMDRWAAHQAREMVTTIERQAQQAEISKLTTNSKPVAVRAASLLREASDSLPEPSNSSGAAVASSGARDVRSNVRASSLIQMWRELEAEAGLTPKHRTASGLSNSGSFSVDEPSGANSDGFDESDAFVDWNSETMTMTTTTASPAHSTSSSMNENEKSRVGSIVRMLSSGNDHEASNTVAADRWRRAGLSVMNPQLRLRGRGEMESFVGRTEQERRRELVAIADQQHVSRFAYRGRLQSMLKLRSLRRQVDVKEQMLTPTRRLELDKLHNKSTISFIRERFDQRGHQYSSSSRNPTVESSRNVQIQFPATTEPSNYTNITEENSNYPCPTNHFTPVSNRYQEITSSIHTQPEPDSPRLASEDLREGSHNSTDGSWDESNLWVSNMDWQRPADSLPSIEWNTEVVAEEIDSFPQQNVSSWDGEGSSSWRRWAVRRRPDCDDFFESFSNNVEIRELHQRRRVSTSLASDFCDKMNQLILSIIQQRAHQSFDENFEENNGDSPFWEQGYHNGEQGESVSSSLVPLQYYHTQHHPESWQSHAPFSSQPSQNTINMEVMQELKSDVAQIHGELNELRLMIESCMDWQTKLRESIKQDILDAIRQTVTSNTSHTHSFSKKSARRDTCRICCEMQVDSLLYSKICIPKNVKPYLHDHYPFDVEFVQDDADPIIDWWSAMEIDQPLLDEPGEPPRPSPIISDALESESQPEDMTITPLDSQRIRQARQAKEDKEEEPSVHSSSSTKDGGDDNDDGAGGEDTVVPSILPLHDL